MVEPLSGGWRGSTRHDSLPSNWDDLVRQVHARSGGRCEWKIDPAAGNFRRCPNRADGGVDHYKGRDYHQLDGLRDSCARHHNAKSSAEGNTAKAALKARGKREPELHPGFIRRK